MIDTYGKWHEEKIILHIPKENGVIMTQWQCGSENMDMNQKHQWKILLI